MGRHYTNEDPREDVIPVEVGDDITFIPNDKFNYDKAIEKDNKNISEGLKTMGISITGLVFGSYLAGVGYNLGPDANFSTAAHIIGGTLLTTFSLINTVNSFKMIRESVKEKRELEFTKKLIKG